MLYLSATVLQTFILRGRNTLHGIHNVSVVVRLPCLSFRQIPAHPVFSLPRAEGTRFIFAGDTTASLARAE
jgi:hypothetical protein